jgi:8-oxo-dGTP pyrophosphatase MutT (NUDIX family)
MTTNPERHDNSFSGLKVNNMLESFRTSCQRRRMSVLHELSRDFRIVEAAPVPSRAADEAAIDAVWQNEKARRGDGLFNGRLFSLVESTPARIVVAAAEYKQFIAQLAQPKRSYGTRIRPIGVTGLSFCRDGLILGRRAAHVTTNPGAWEPAPAGTLDQADAQAVLLTELREEIGIEHGRVTRIEPLALIEDPTSLVTDLVFELRIDAGCDEVLAAHRRTVTAEYDEIAVVAPAALAAFLATHEVTVLTLLAPLLRRRGLIA